MEAESMLDRIVAFKVSETTSSHEISRMEEAVGRAAVQWAVSYTHLTLPTIYSV